MSFRSVGKKKKLVKIVFSSYYNSSCCKDFEDDANTVNSEVSNHNAKTSGKKSKAPGIKKKIAKKQKGKKGGE